MTENELSAVIVDRLLFIHRNTGPGLFESVYEEIVYYELLKAGLEVKRQYPISICWDGKKIRRIAFKADLLVNDRVILELKAVELLSPVHYKQVKTYLNLTGLKLGLLVNFNEILMKNGIHRVVNGI